MQQSNINAQALDLEWAKNSTASSTYSSNTVAIASDKEGYVYLTGLFSGKLYFGGDSILSAIGSTDGFVLKVSAAGKVIWAKQFGHAGSSNHCWDVAADDSGNVFITGWFTTTTNLNPEGASKLLTSAASWDAYVCKLDSSGNFIWGKQIATKKDLVRGEYIEVDKAGDVYVSGYYQATVDLNPGSGVDTFPRIVGVNTTSYDHFLCKIDGSGNYLWGVSYQKGSGIDKIGGLALDPSGYAYLVGSYFNSLDFQPNSGMGTLNAVRYYDMHMVKVDPSGKFIWAKSFGGSGDGDYAYDIAADENYNLYIVGNFNGTANLDPNDPTGANGHFFIPALGASYLYDIFVLKTDTAGNYIWAQTFGSPEHDNGLAVTVDQEGNVYATGSIKDTVKFVLGSNLPGDMVVPNGGGQLNPFVVKFDSTGKYLWSTTFGNDKGGPASGIGTERGDDLAIDAFGNLYVTGIFVDTVDFDPPNKIELDANEGSVFLLKYGCNDTSSLVIDTSSCDVYTYNEQTYDSSGTYIQVYRNASGCDSTVYLNLTITPIPKPTISINGFILGTAPANYSTYQWFLNGVAIPGAINSTYTVTANGDYTVAVTNEEGCAETSEIYEVNNYTSNIGNISLANLVKVYPNPTMDVIHITAPVPTHIILTSIEGKVLLQAEEPDNISLKEFANGIYFLSISDKMGNLIKIEKLIKQ